MYPEMVKFQSLDKLNDLQIVNLGTGMGYYDFDYEDMEIRGFNFALPQQNLQFDYKLLTYYYSRCQAGCKVCIVLPYCIFCADFFEELEGVYERYYSILPSSEVEAYCKISYEMYRDKLKKKYIAGRLELIKALSAEEMERQSKETVAIWEKQLKIISCSSGELNEHNISEIQKTKKWLKNIIEFCVQKHLEPVIVVPPLSQVLLDRLSPEFRKTHFYDVLYEVVKEDLLILDYTKDEKYCDPGLYGWPGFLIKKAAKEFTRDVINRIGSL